MRIAFLDSIDRIYTVDSAWTEPMGGTQSGVCYLAVALAERGHDVILLSHHESESIQRGVRCLPLDGYFSESQMQALQLDVVVIVNGARNGKIVRELVGSQPRIVLWAHHLTDQPSITPLGDPEFSGAFDGYAMVSGWQSREYRSVYSLPAEKVSVKRNAVSPHCEKLLGLPIEQVLAAKVKPILTYTSTPFRGLDILLHIFPAIREAVPGCELHIYSSMKVYGVELNAEEQGHKALYDAARSMEGIEYKSSVPQGELLEAMLGFTVLAYPNTYLETSCIAALEAMAAGLSVVSTAAGALPETTAGHATLIPSRLDPQEYLRRFVEATTDYLKKSEQPEYAHQIVAQRDYIRDGYLWSQRAHEWEQWVAAI